MASGLGCTLQTDIETKLILDVALFDRHGTDPAAAFLHGFKEKHDLFGGYVSRRSIRLSDCPSFG